MAAADRGSTADLREWLNGAGRRLRFFQALRLLHRAHPDRLPVGRGDDPRREAVRLRSDISFAFPTSEVAALEAGDDENPAALSAAFMGVANPHSYGSLPVPYAEIVTARRRDGDRALDDFLALFDHRLLSLFYRAWETGNHAVAYEQAAAGTGGRFENALLCLLGLGTAAHRDRLPLADVALIARADVFARGVATARGLASLLESHFGVPITIRSFVPGWYVLEDAERSRLGRAACTLGRDVVLGERVQLAQSRFRIRIGPLPASEFADLLPGADGARELAALVQLAVGPEYDFEYQLVLQRDEVPSLRLRSDRAAADPRLGWNTWLHARPLPEDPQDVVIVHDQEAGDPAALSSKGMGT
jgi:type VI secretion system protein ImpH